MYQMMTKPAARTKKLLRIAEKTVTECVISSLSLSPPGSKPMDAIISRGKSFLNLIFNAKLVSNTERLIFKYTF